MKAVILLGGLGTRLKPFTLERPKPLLPIQNRPFISYQLDQLKKHGVRDVVLALGYRAAHFRRHLGSGRAWGMRFTYSLEKSPLGTGGAIRKALPFLSGPAFVLNGDALCSVDFTALAKIHRDKRADATLTLVSVDDPSAFGLIETEPDGRIRRFVEKPSPDQITVDTINAGFYLLEPSVVRSIPAGRAVSVEREVFPKLAGQGFRVQSYLHRGYWADIGTLKSYWQTHMDLLESGALDGLASVQADGNRRAGRGIRVHRTAKIPGSALIGDRCRVGARVVFEGRVCLGPRCVVEEDARLADCVIHEDTVIGARSRVERSLIGRICRIGPDCRVGPGSVLGDRAMLPAFSGQADGFVAGANSAGDERRARSVRDVTRFLGT
jgi:mannose-1-phosphate guanylyltransferase